MFVSPLILLCFLSKKTLGGTAVRGIRTFNALILETLRRQTCACDSLVPSYDHMMYD
jgi:hypothetical protein